jgi:hypothetical protein
MSDLEEYSSYTKVADAREQVAIYEFNIQGFDRILKIKVLRHARTELPYIGLANYQIKSGKESSFHQCVTPASSIKDAVGEALRGFVMRFDTMDKGLQIKKIEEW